MPNEKPSIYYILLSRKFWMSAIGLILILVTAWNQKPFPTDAVVTAIMGVVAAFVTATALEDGLSNRNATTTTLTTPSDSVQISTGDSTTSAPPLYTPMYTSAPMPPPVPTKPRGGGA